MITFNLTVTQIYTVDLAEQTYQISQFANNTVSIYCLEQLDYPLLALSLYVPDMNSTLTINDKIKQDNLNKTQLWLVFESPAENKVRVENNIPLPASWKEEILEKNQKIERGMISESNFNYNTGLVSSLMASYTSNTEYLVIFQNNTFNFIVFDTFTANYVSSTSQLSVLFVCLYSV